MMMLMYDDVVRIISLSDDDDDVANDNVDV
jgi:hypothetical protein